MELLWVRWLGVEPQYSWGFREARLPKVGFVPEGDYNAFGFLDPSFVIRGCHLIPSFSDGRTTALLQQGASVARHPTNDDDWCSFYVNIFADRDMFCRFAAIGVGHEVQYPMQMNSGAHDGGDELDSDNDSSCAGPGDCGVNDMIVDQSSDGWNSEGNYGEEEEDFESKAGYVDESDSGVDPEDSSSDASDNDDINFWATT